MLWFDNGTDSFDKKITRAACDYHRTHGVFPNVCYVHPDTLPKHQRGRVGKVTIHTDLGMCRQQYWLKRE